MVERGILFDEAVGEFEKRFIKRILERTNGNQSRAAELLGIHRNTLSRKMTEYKLDHRRGRGELTLAQNKNGPESRGRFV
jgi:DNA-binding NtrC family response regulator